MWYGHEVDRGVAHRQHEMGDVDLAPMDGHNHQMLEEQLPLLERALHHCHGCDGVVAVAGDEWPGQERRWEDENWCSLEGDYMVADLDSTQAVKAWRAGYTWVAGWRLRDCWVGGMSGHRRNCSWAMLGKEEGGGTEQKRWVVVVAVVVEQRGNEKGQVTYLAPNYGVMEGVQSAPAPPSLVS